MIKNDKNKIYDRDGSKIEFTVTTKVTGKKEIDKNFTISSTQLFSDRRGRVGPS